MTLQAKATLGSVLLATIMVTLVSGVDLGSFMDLGLEATLERADVIKDVAKDAVIDALNRRRDVELREALGVLEKSAELAGRLSFTLADLGYRFPAYPLPPGETPSSFLRSEERRVGKSVE